MLSHQGTKKQGIQFEERGFARRKEYITEETSG